MHEIYLARGLSHADRGDFELQHEEAEMEVFWVPMAELLDAVLDGRVREGPLAQAVLAYDVLATRALDGLRAVAPVSGGSPGSPRREQGRAENPRRTLAPGRERRRRT